MEDLGKLIEAARSSGNVDFLAKNSIKSLAKDLGKDVFVDDKIDDEQLWGQMESKLNDKAFNLDDMERFADEAEASQQESIPSDTDGSVYSDLDLEPTKPDDTQDYDEEDQERIFQMNQLEDELVGEKPWNLRGEIKGAQRPANSLLDQYLDFEVGVKPQLSDNQIVPNQEVEDIIQQRILDINYDDVVPRKAEVVKKEHFTAEQLMNFEKSRKGLGELYEEDYKRDVLNVPVVNEQERAKRTAAGISRKICSELDRLVGLNVPEKPILAETEVKNSAKAIALEEKIPYAVSTAATATVTEVFDPKHATFESTGEINPKATRRKSKQTIRTRKKEKLKAMVQKAAQDPNIEKFEYRKQLREQKAKKELIERKKQPKANFTRSSQFFKTMEDLKTERPKEKEPNLAKKVKL